MEKEVTLAAAVLEQDEIRSAIRTVRSRMRRASDPDPVHFEFLEDDLREGQETLAEIGEFFEDVIDALSRSNARGADLVDLADDATVLDKVDYLMVVVGNVRRRLLSIGAQRPATTPSSGVERRQS